MRDVDKMLCWCDAMWCHAVRVWLRVVAAVLRLLLLLLAVSHALVPLALSNAGLVVRRSRLNVLHHAFDSGSGLVAVAVHCDARGAMVSNLFCVDGKQLRGRRWKTLTSTLQEDRPSGEDSALEPGHAIAQIVEPNLLSTERFPHPGDGDLTLLAFAHRDLDHDSAVTLGGTPR